MIHNAVTNLRVGHCVVGFADSPDTRYIPYFTPVVTQPPPTSGLSGGVVLLIVIAVFSVFGGGLYIVNRKRAQKTKNQLFPLTDPRYSARLWGGDDPRHLGAPEEAEMSCRPNL